MPKKEEAVVPPPAKPDDSPVLYFRTTATTPTPKPVVPEPTPEKIEIQPEPPRVETSQVSGLKIVGKIDLDAPKPVVIPPKPVEKPVDITPPAAVVPPPTPVVVLPPVEEKPFVEEKTEPKAIEPQPPVVEKEQEKSKIEPILEEKPTEKKEEAKREEPAKKIQKSTSDSPKTPPAIAKTVPKPAAKEEVAPRLPIEEPEEPELIEAKADPLRGLKIVGKIELPTERRASNESNSNRDKDKKRKRKRLRKAEKVVEQTTLKQKSDEQRDTIKSGSNPSSTTTTGHSANKKSSSGGNLSNKKGGGNRRDRKDEISEKEVVESIKATNARLAGTTRGKNFGADKRRERRRERAEANEERLLQEQEDTNLLKVTEFISANELASLMGVSVQEVISVCLSMGMFVSINQRLDAESITLIADEFDYEVEFISAEEEIKADVEEEADDEADLIERAPIVTIMGHVDHGKTSLLDYIRRTRVAAGEAGGITQHIGAYSVKTEGGRRIAFLDTPGHEAFTAMRARGAKVTDVVIIVIAADDSVMPQTREAINHAQNAGVPIVFAFSKIDKPGANPDKIREALANMNILVEEWGGKYQTQEISSKSGVGIPDLLEKVLFEADLLELKANPKRKASGTVIEASLDKGRGYLATILVQTGTLRVGDVILAGANYGRVKAMFDASGARLKEAGPSTPVQLLGLNGAPQAGDKFNVMENEREAREIANKREQIMREQTIRTRKHITLEEIGRRKAIGTFKELNVIVKGDVDGSVEALSDSLLKLSTEEVQVNIIHKAVGQIAESDVNLAIASDAIIVGFQVRPSNNAKKLAEQEQIEIRLYSVIYDAINEIKDAMLGLLEPTMEEVIVGNAEVREVFKISKVGTVAGCYVTDGSIKRNNKVRLIRDFIVIHEGEISQLKRFKDDVNEVKSGFEFGLSIKGLNDIQIGDVIESFELREVKRTL
ncbi:MAG: translation initiation factor IF-2, partial [Runella sp.]